ncbi:hypothetical protein PoB_002505400 [Plakobranchus ocellatus]|uniref:Uncharacterized protein n=1 Tax=Plakobranchus ocellatus TaxID=259542 RepID=A0AAV3ZT75_9GAST|nr:hypothetical protein PoB_002505400 [Plakobranchus ocellatus]
MSGATATLDSTRKFSAAAATTFTTPKCMRTLSLQQPPTPLAPSSPFRRETSMVNFVVVVVVVAVSLMLFATPSHCQVVRYVYYQGAPGDRGADGAQGIPGIDGRPVSVGQVFDSFSLQAVKMPLSDLPNYNVSRGVASTVDSKSALRFAGNLLSQV